MMLIHAISSPLKSTKLRFDDTSVDDLPIQDMRTFAMLLSCRSEMLLITMKAVAQNLSQDTYTGK